jgi:hypothetical protein
MPTFIIKGDTSLLEAAETIETRDDLTRHMFVTLEPGPDRTLWIRGVPLKSLADFEGLLYQLDKDDDQDAVVLRQVNMRFWPWEESATRPEQKTPSAVTLDEILQAAFAEFYTSLSKPGSPWFAKERECVNRFAMAHLVPACTPGTVLHHPTQIGIEMSVKQPETVGTRLTAPKDLVIWGQPCDTCWSPEMSPERSPLAVLEWKVQRPTAAKQSTAEDQEWLTEFSRENPSSLGYSVFVEWAEGGLLRKMEVTRCSEGLKRERWFVRE